MHDLFTNIYGRAVKVENDLDHVDGANYSGAKSPRAEKNDLFHGTTVASLAHGPHYNSHVRSYRNGYGLLINAPSYSQNELAA